ncbi:unnamed protein product [Clonostachys rosea]|uniref:NADH:flavin oxidoreductase/NADH oxidase N-terminal domain-containing protein n=1 Tax=Bionectria ochroleuca TaxID=29856 RepID=A0ABY6UGS5_BIOOC|nr:unnamed protein product [Clonostachys rosea]
MAIPRYSSGDVSPLPLGRSLEFPASGRVAKNRFLKSPMAETLATWSPRHVYERGIPTDELVELYRRWGEGKNNWGVIVTGNIDTNWAMVNGPGDMIITPDCLFEGERFEKFKELAAAAKANGSLIVAQITHPGRQVQESVSPTSVSASAVQLEPKDGRTFGKPHAATRAEMKKIVDEFAYAAEYLEKAGFDGIELHGAHGYLIAQFLSRTTNKRTDEYGVQTTENRMRFVSDIVRGIKARVSPNFIVSAKLNSVEFQEGGVTPDEAREVCETLEKLGLDFVELSGGTYEELGLKFERESTKIREGFFLKFAQAISQALGPDRKMKLYLSGGMRSVGPMISALDSVDGIGLGRPAAAEPRLASDILEGRASGALKPLTPGEEFPLSLIAAGAQIWQIASGKEPFQLWDEKVLAQLEQDIGIWFGKKTEDGDKLEYTKPVEYTGPQSAYGSNAAVTA